MGDAWTLNPANAHVDLLQYGPADYTSGSDQDRIGILSEQKPYHTMGFQFPSPCVNTV